VTVDLYCAECDTVHYCGEHDHGGHLSHPVEVDISHADHGVCADCRDRGVHLRLSDEETLATADPSERARCNCGWRGPWRPHWRYGRKAQSGEYPSTDAMWHGIISRSRGKPNEVGMVLLVGAMGLGEHV
jgi:hypothetical protein